MPGWTPTGGARPSSIRCIRAASPTATATASATSPASPRGCPTSPDWASTRSGSARSTRPRWPTAATTSPTTATSIPQLGTLDDFDDLVAAAHAAGIRVIVDIVPNHTSDLHPWFAEALASEPGSAGPGPLHLPRRHRSRRLRAAVGLGLALRRTGLDPGARRSVVLPPVRPRAARPQLGQPRGPRRLPAHAAVLGRSGRRRLPGRRGARAGQGPLRAAAQQARRWRTRACRSTASDPLYDRDEVHEIYAEWRQVFDSYDPPRTAVAEACAPSERARPLRPADRPGPGLQLRPAQGRLLRRRLPRRHHLLPRTRRPRPARPRPGCCPTTTWSGTPPATRCPPGWTWTTG